MFFPSSSWDVFFNVFFVFFVFWGSKNIQKVNNFRAEIGPERGHGDFSKSAENAVRVSKNQGSKPPTISKNLDISAPK